MKNQSQSWQEIWRKMKDENDEQKGELTGNPITVKCAHCNGTGKCNCFNCYVYSRPKGLNSEDFGKIVKDNPQLQFACSICNGYGFLILERDGSVIIPKVKK